MTDHPQPREGITGTVRDEDDLLSLDEKAIPRRMMMANLAMCLHSATLVGNPAPVVARMYDRISHPQPGDLVVETSRFYRQTLDVEAFGILLAHRDEWAQTDDEYAKDFAENLNGEQDDGWRGVEHNVHYVQYGPQPDDICRWVNCSFITIPTDARFEQKCFGDPHRKPGAVTFIRDDLVAGLADAGIELR